MKRFQKLSSSLVVALAAMSFAACGDDDGSTVRDGSGSESGSGSGSESGSGSGSGVAACNPFGNAADADTTVNVTLREWSIDAEVDTAPAGPVHFAIENLGSLAHELAVIKGFDNVADLPVEDGILDESALPEGALIGEVEGFPAGETCDGTFDLAAGDYLLVCLIVEAEGAEQSHLAEGMVASFRVS